jgi:hypothetical protein
MGNVKGGWDEGSTQRPLTPARYESMPKTQEYWVKRAEMDQELIIEQAGEIIRLKQTINQLRQKLQSKNT